MGNTFYHFYPGGVYARAKGAFPKVYPSYSSKKAIQNRSEHFGMFSWCGIIIHARASTPQSRPEWATQRRPQSTSMNQTWEPFALLWYQEHLSVQTVPLANAADCQ